MKGIALIPSKRDEAMKRLKEKIDRFMIGRYGMDRLNQFLAILVLILVAVDLFTHSKVIYWLELIGLVLFYFRMISKNFKAREKENQIYLSLYLKAQDMVMKWKFRFEQSRKYHIYKCPNCGQKIRIPRGKGRISIHCPKCNIDFIRKS